MRPKALHLEFAEHEVAPPPPLLLLILLLVVLLDDDAVDDEGEAFGAGGDVSLGVVFWVGDGADGGGWGASTGSSTAVDMGCMAGTAVLTLL